MQYNSQERISRKISYRNPFPYKDLTPIGSGTYGTVFLSVYNDSKYAIKKYTFGDDPLHITTVREIKALRMMQSPYIIELKEIIVEKGQIYLVFPFYKKDLYKLMKDENLTLNDCRHIFWQILKGVSHMHSKKILHRDLKPANVLIHIVENSQPVISCDDVFPGEKSKFNIKICDFGMTKALAKEMTPGIVTLWYRAPELLLGAVAYSEKIDIWSLGCILLEMISKNIPFQAKTEIEQIEEIVALLGPINKNTMPQCENYPLFSKYNLSESKNSFSQKFSNINQSARDLIEKMLVLDPSKRLSVDECLLHPFFTNDDQVVKKCR